MLRVCCIKLLKLCNNFMKFWRLFILFKGVFVKELIVFSFFLQVSVSALPFISKFQFLSQLINDYYFFLCIILWLVAKFKCLTTTQSEVVWSKNVHKFRKSTSWSLKLIIYKWFKCLQKTSCWIFVSFLGIKRKKCHKEISYFVNIRLCIL